MKKTLILLAIAASLYSCKKENSQPAAVSKCGTIKVISYYLNAGDTTHLPTIELQYHDATSSYEYYRPGKPQPGIYVGMEYCHN